MSEEIVFRRFFQGLDTPRSLTCWLLYSHGEHAQLASLSIEPGSYLESDTELFRRDYAATSFLKKFKGLKTGVDTKAVALSGLVASERSCATTNRLFRLRSAGELQFPSAVEHVLSRAREKIAKVTEGWSVGGMLECCRFGPGATFALSGADASVRCKTTALDVTASAAPFARVLFEEDSMRAEQVLGVKPEGPFCYIGPFTRVRGNRVTVVPKNAKTDRVIAIEPSLNMELQLGAGKFLRERLKEFCKLDLSDQGQNQRLASQAYARGLATIDLSSASDSISSELVWDLLPYDLADYLDRLRSRSYQLDDEWHASARWSSMGNGYTFELETLIFWALSSSISGWSRVYGDDIIVRQADVPLLREVFRSVGFTINDDKSFDSGLFFESCGMHYFRGIDVTPVYQQELLVERVRTPECTRSWTRLGNRIRTLAYRMGDGFGCLGILRPAWLACYDNVKDFGLFQPFACHDGTPYEGDAGLAADRSEILAHALPSAIDNWRFKGAVEKPLYQSSNEKPLLYQSLRAPKHTPVKPRGLKDYALSVRSLSDLLEHLEGAEAIRGRTRVKVSKLSYRRGWTDVGWII